MSVLLNEILADLRAQRIDYEEFLKRIGALARTVHAGKADDTPEKLNTPGKRALYNNLVAKVKRDESADDLQHEPVTPYRTDTRAWALNLALQIDDLVRRVRPNAFRGNKAKENVIKASLLPLLGNDEAEVERVFLIIKAQTEY